MKFEQIIRWLDATAFLALAVWVFTHAQWSIRTAVGAVIAISGFALWMVARAQLGASFAVRAEARKLVTHGLYARIAHPIYLFGFVAYLGLVIALNHWAGYLYVALTGLFQWLRTHKEEQVLNQAFGDAYRKYRASTWL